MSAISGGQGSRVERKVRYLARQLTTFHPISTVEKTLYRNKVLSTDSLSLPSFLCIGFRKAGTTWLFENLHHHPELYLPPYKNVRYFSEGFAQPLADYAEHFAPGVAKVKGDFSNGYGFIPRHRIRFIQAVMPEVKLIALLRDPVEREWSEFIHRVTQQNLKLETMTEQKVLAALETSQLQEAGYYTGVLDNWLRVFPSEQLFVGFYDAIRSCPKELLADIFKFLGVSTEVDWETFPYQEVIVPPAGVSYREQGLDPWRGVVDNTHRNTSYLLTPRYRAFLNERLEPELTELRARFGERVPWLAPEF